jgi:perosamine synthetase
MKFSISFDKRDIPTLHRYWDQIFENNKWSEGYFTQSFEEKWSEHNQLQSVAFSSWSGAAAALLDYYQIKDQTVLVPSNTFMATPLSVIKAGGKVQFVDCNKTDLCMSFEDLKAKANEFKPKAIWLVHIGGHIAFETEKIAEFCRKKNILLFEDCAHAHGAEWSGKKPGQWGAAGVYSFYATKTLPTGEGGMLVTSDKSLTEYAKKFRNYGKFDYEVHGLNYRMNEFTAAIGLVQTNRLKEIIQFKNEYAAKLDQQYSNRLKLPNGMKSGYYKYIVFDKIENSTGKVYEDPCHKILKHPGEFPNTDWIAKNHWCVPIYYQPDLA